MMIAAIGRRMLLPLLSVWMTAATSCAAQTEGRRSVAEGASYEESTVTVEGVERRYIFAGAQDREEAAPAVIVLHGGGGSAESMLRMSRMLSVARRNGFIAVFPQGLGRREGMGTWNAGGCCAYAVRENVDDIAFIDALIDDIVARRGADASRIYIAGFSNGGMMTHMFAAAEPGKVAAAGVVSGAVFDGAGRAKGPVPVLLIHGEKDRAVPIAGGMSELSLVRSAQTEAFSSFATSVERWLAANGCDGDPLETVDGAVTHRVYARCASGAPVETYVLEDGAHAWPGGEKGREAADEPSTALSASDVLWAFFEKQAR